MSGRRDGSEDADPDRDHDHGHGHEHGDGHDHDGTAPPSRAELRIKALESLLVARGVVDPAELDAVIDLYEHKVGPRSGARVVARAWVDPGFRERLLRDANAAIAELALPGESGDRLVLVENSEAVHNVIVCTLCSCYPWQTLGLPPNWFKSAAYRSRVVIDPRGVLAEFGLRVPDAVEVRVWDSNADLRYMVLPRRPDGTEGWSEAQLARLVTRDSMIGTGTPKAPEEVGP